MVKKMSWFQEELPENLDDQMLIVDRTCSIGVTLFGVFFVCALMYIFFSLGSSDVVGGLFILMIGLFLFVSHFPKWNFIYVNKLGLGYRLLGFQHHFFEWNNIENIEINRACLIRCDVGLIVKQKNSNKHLISHVFGGKACLKLGALEPLIIKLNYYKDKYGG